MLRELFQEAYQRLTHGENLALVTIVHKSGSSPRKRGACMLVNKHNGLIYGTVGGGALENAGIVEAQRAIDLQTGLQLRYNLDNKQAGTLGMVCGGSNTLHTHFLQASSSELIALLEQALNSFNQEDELPYQLLLDCTCEVDEFKALYHVNTLTPYRASSALALLDGTGALKACYMPSSQSCEFSNLQEIFSQHNIAQTHNSLHEHGKSMGCNYEPELIFTSEHAFLACTLTRPARAIIFGGGHVARALSKVLYPLGFEILIVEDREEFCNPEDFAPHTKTILCPMEDVSKKIVTTPSDHILVMTRGHGNDFDALACMLKRNVAYVGCIGSKAKSAQTRKRLAQEAGCTPEQIAQLYCPIGLDIGAETPEEIAISIAAEIIACQYGKATPRNHQKQSSNGIVFSTIK